VSSGRKAAVGLLVQSITDFDIEANNGLTGVQVARLQGHTDIAAMLIQAGAEDRPLPTGQASGSGYRSNMSDASGSSPHPAPRLRTLSGKNITRAEYDQYAERFLQAAESGDIESILLCFSKGVDVEERDKPHNKTALHWAAEKGHTDIAQLLLDWGSNLAMQDRYGETPLHYAADSGHFKVIKVICERNPSFAAVDDRGRTALRCARDNHHTLSVQALLGF
jgi:ankyrin repeat protein